MDLEFRALDLGFRVWCLEPKLQPGGAIRSPAGLVRCGVAKRLTEVRYQRDSMVLGRDAKKNNMYVRDMCDHSAIWG